LLLVRKPYVNEIGTFLYYCYPEAPNLKASRDWQEPEGDVYIRDIWDCISLKRKVIDGQSMIGKPNLQQ
jgi:hypothetical protein